MRDVLDPSVRWVGRAAFALARGNKRPVALDDALSVLKDSGPVTVAVLANDFDPEGQPLTLVSASAALGTAVAEADNTVTYTPPAGISGFDTVVYTIADDLGQTRDGQVNVTISDPQLSIDTLPDNTLAVTAETGLIDITVTNPAEFAGTWQADTADLVGGPVNLVPPAISGTAAVGNVLTAGPGLWIHDTGAGVPATGWQWRRGGSDIAGETGTSYTVAAGDIGPGVSVAETLTDGFGQRTAASAPVGVGFAPGDDAQLLGWWDAGDAATISQSAGAVNAWTDKAGGAALTQIDGTRQPLTGSRSLNGLNVLDFTSGDFMERALTVPASGDIAFHMALILDGAANAFEAILALEAAANDFQVDANNAAQFDGRLNLAGAGTSVNLTGGPFSGAFILSVTFDRTGAGQAEVHVSNVLRAGTAYTASLDASAALHLMSNRSKNAFSPGAVGELIVTGDVGNRGQHHAYLAARWGLS